MDNGAKAHRCAEARAMIVRLSGFFLLVVLLGSVGACALRKPSTPLDAFPFDMRYTSDGQAVNLSFDSHGVVTIRVKGQSKSYGTLPSSGFEELAKLLRSIDFRRCIEDLRPNSESVRLSRERVLILYSRGEVFGAVEKRAALPSPVAVSLADMEDVPLQVVSLVSIVDRLGTDAFGAIYPPILSHSHWNPTVE